jgi:hypothetical protein
MKLTAEADPRGENILSLPKTRDKSQTIHTEKDEMSARFMSNIS